MLDRTGLRLSDIDLIEIHEAFAAQVLCILKMLGSDAFAEARLGRSEAIGEIDWANLRAFEQMDWVWKETLRVMPVTGFLPRRMWFRCMAGRTCARFLTQRGLGSCARTPS